MDVKSLKNVSFEEVFALVLKTPGICVNREKFLADTFGDNPELKTKRPIDIYDISIIDKRADDTIALAKTAVTTLSTAAGIPGGIAMIPAALVDIVQYYANSLVIIQKLGYIYGWPSLQDKDKNLNDANVHALLLYLGVSMGVSVANKFIQELAEGVGKVAAKKIGQTAVTKTIWYPVLKKIMAAFNKKLTKEAAQQMVKKAIPFFGAALSGVLTLLTFSIETKRLKKSLKDEMKFSSSLNNHFVFDSIR